MSSNTNQQPHFEEMRQQHEAIGMANVTATVRGLQDENRQMRAEMQQTRAQMNAMAALLAQQRQEQTAVSGAIPARRYTKAQGTAVSVGL